MAYDEKRKQALKCQGSNHTEINCRNGIRVVAQECPPGLRRRPPVPDHVFGDRRFGDLTAAGIIVIHTPAVLDGAGASMTFTARGNSNDNSAKRSSATPPTFCLKAGGGRACGCTRGTALQNELGPHGADKRPRAL